MDLKKRQILINNKVYSVIESDKKRAVFSDNYNYLFYKDTGEFQRWGNTLKDDPLFAPSGPEILDLEVSVNGCPNACKFCYKSNNNSEAKNMSLSTFKQILDKMPPTLTQIAFGITGVQTNPDFIPMMKYARSKGVIPNFTLSGIDITNELAAEIAPIVGGLAVSAYQSDKNVCYDTVQLFSSKGVTQTNIHLMVSQETLPFAYEVLKDIKKDERLSGLNAIVFLGVKPKGRAKDQYSSLSLEQYRKLIEYCFSRNIPFGFDSCSAQKFEATVREMDMVQDKKDYLLSMSESCESTLFSFYCNVDGKFSPCSFTESEKGWEDGGISLLSCDNFLEDVWYNERVVAWREKLLSKFTSKNGCRECQTFPEINIKSKGT